MKCEMDFVCELGGMWIVVLLVGVILIEGFNFFVVVECYGDLLWVGCEIGIMF